MISKAKLNIARCSYKASKYACENFHYSKKIPPSKLIHYGVWENEKFIGSVIYGYGANPNIAKFYNMIQTEVCELVRVALTKHQNPVSKILAITLKLLQKENPNLKIVVSYADATNQNHLGIIYQATNWIYEGKSINKSDIFSINKEIIHPKTINNMFGTTINLPAYVKREKGHQVKHKYIYILDKNLKGKFKSKEYPKNNNAEEKVVS